MNTLSIPVPSRVYTLNVTSPRPLEGMRVAVKDIYGVRPDEWLPLVMRIAPHAPFETGAPTPDDGNKEAFSQEF